jgi:hypothetical protein
MLASGRAGWYGSPAYSSIREVNVSFYRGISTRIQDLPTYNFYDFH